MRRIDAEGGKMAKCADEGDAHGLGFLKCFEFLENERGQDGMDDVCGICERGSGFVVLLQAHGRYCTVAAICDMI